MDLLALKRQELPLARKGAPDNDKDDFYDTVDKVTKYRKLLELVS